MKAKYVRNFIDEFLIEDKSKESLEVRNPKECWLWYSRAIQDLEELERLAEIGRATETALAIDGMNAYIYAESGCEYDITTVEDLIKWYEIEEY